MLVNRALLASLPLLVVACLPPPQAGSPTARVDRGELYRPGKTPYDEYFASVHDLQVEMAGVPDDRRAARSTLTQSLGLLPTAPTERVVDVMKDRSAELRHAGGRFVITGTMATADGKATPDARTIAQGLSSCLGGEKQIADRMTKMPERADALSQHEATLEQTADGDFPMLSRAQVKTELQASKRALAQITDNARAAAKSSQQLIDDLTKAAVGKQKPTTTTGVATPTPTTTTPPTTPKPATTATPAPADNGDFNP